LKEFRNANRILVRQPEGNRPRRCRHNGEDTVTIDPEEIMLENVKRINVAQERGQWRAVMGPVMYLGFRKRLGLVSACQEEHVAVSSVLSWFDH
jgi:hypothetical protein